MLAKNPYKLLGVKKSATDADIRKAYRTLAKKYHPDVNPDDKVVAEKFKEISAAYTLLSDKNLRRQYDTGQVDASGQQQNSFASGFQNAPGAGFGHRDLGDMGDLLSSLFGMQFGGSRQRTGHAFARPRKGADVRYQLEISLPDAVRGSTKQVQLANRKGLKISIPEGVTDDTTLRLRGKGEPGTGGGPAGDATITIKVKNHKFLHRDGNKLRLDLPITLKEALLGAKVGVPTPHGRINLTVPAGSSSGRVLRLKGKGIKGGNLLVRLMVIVPDSPGKPLVNAVESAVEQPNPRAKMHV